MSAKPPRFPHTPPASTEEHAPPVRRHESRAIAIFQTLLGKEAVKSEAAVPREAHSIDALIRVVEPTDLWGPFGPLVANRTLVLELESGAPSLRGLWTGLGKLAWTVRREWKDISKRGRRYPMLLFLSADCPGWIRPGWDGQSRDGPSRKEQSRNGATQAACRKTH